jgi:hypothetical protein
MGKLQNRLDAPIILAGQFEVGFRDFGFSLSFVVEIPLFGR